VRGFTWRFAMGYRIDEIEGIGASYREKLKQAGVDTIKELRNRNAENLAAAIDKINKEKKLARSTPTVSDITKWIEQAKKTEPKITY
jgi:nucleotidyltransferase/DNA polymerase involved in DNA repair